MIYSSRNGGDPLSTTQAASNWRMSLYDASELLANMPVALRCDVIAHVERETISRIRFLDNKTTPFASHRAGIARRFSDEVPSTPAEESRRSRTWS